MSSTAAERSISTDALPACLHAENLNRLVSLWDLMKRFDLVHFALHNQMLSTAAGKFMNNEPQTLVHPDIREYVIRKLNEIREYCHAVGFNRAALKVGRSLDRVNFDGGSLVTEGWAASELTGILEFIISDAVDYQFVVVDRERVRYLEQENLFGPKVKEAFPSATQDIREAGSCLAVGCDTGAVFHLMRAVEWALRALCVDLGMRSVRRKNSKTGVVSFTPLGWSEWEVLLNQLRSRIDEVRMKTKRGKKKQLFQEFYYPAIQDIEAIKEAWRNHVMHSRRFYTPEDAEAVMSHVKRLMVKLAERISE